MSPPERQEGIVDLRRLLYCTSVWLLSVADAYTMDHGNLHNQYAIVTFSMNLRLTFLVVVNVTNPSLESLSLALINM